MKRLILILSFSVVTANFVFAQSPVIWTDTELVTNWNGKIEKKNLYFAAMMAHSFQIQLHRHSNTRYTAYKHLFTSSNGEIIDAPEKGGTIKYVKIRSEYSSTKLNFSSPSEFLEFISERDYVPIEQDTTMEKGKVKFIEYTFKNIKYKDYDY